MEIAKNIKIFILGLFFLHMGFSDLYAAKTAIVISKKIRPYMLILNGMKNELEKNSDLTDFHSTRDIFFASDFNAESLGKKLYSKNYKTVTGIGSEALFLINKVDIPGIKKIYTGVLKPGVYVNEDQYCGISLEIPVKTQLKEIKTRLPGIKKIGLLCDPLNNIDFYESAVKASSEFNIEIIPLFVSSREEISKKLKSSFNKFQLVWMIPDKTIISERIVKYVIKTGIYNKKGVVGYNSFFTRSGSLFSFEFDYELLGNQTALKVIDHYKGVDCYPEDPLFRVEVNSEVASILDIGVSEK